MRKRSPWQLLFLVILGSILLGAPAWGQCGKGGITCSKVCGPPQDVGQQQYETCVANCEAQCVCETVPQPAVPCAFEICTSGSWKTAGSKPKGTSCIASNGQAGTCNGSNSAPACIPLPAPVTYSIGGSVSGLTGGTVTLILDNGSTVESSGGSFTFPAKLSNSSNYSVTISMQPSGQTCTVSNGAGKINDANISNISITCSTPPDVIACDSNGCISEVKFLATICNELSSELGKNAVGYICAVGGLPPIYAGLARTASDPPTTAMSPYPMTNLASVSKTLTAIGVLQVLAAYGLTIDSPISPFIYSDWAQGLYVSDITFRDLLTHHLYWCEGNTCPIPSGTTYNPANYNGDACGGNINYTGVKTMIAGGLMVPPSQVTQNEYGNCNFAIPRELLPVILGNGPMLNGLADGPTRAMASASLFISYMDQNVFQPVGLPTRGGGSTQCSPPPSGPLAMLSYPLPAGTANGDDWGWLNTPLPVCGPVMWELSANDLMKVINDLANGSVLLTSSEKTQMFANCLGWDCSVRTDCPTPYVCKNGADTDGAGAGVRTYAGVFKGTVPVVVIVNSPLVEPYTDTIDLVGTAYTAAYCGATAAACP